MGIMKYKENGEWKELPATVNVNTVEHSGAFTWETISRATYTTYNLYNYVKPGEHFLIMFTACRDGDATNSPIFVWDSRERVVRTSTRPVVEGAKYIAMNQFSEWFPNQSTLAQYMIGVSFNEETGVFTLNGESFGLFALLFHA